MPNAMVATTTWSRKDNIIRVRGKRLKSSKKNKTDIPYLQSYPRENTNK
jgi:hypothetical protein